LLAIDSNPRFIDFGPIRDLQAFNNICSIDAPNPNQSLVYGMSLGSTDLDQITDGYNIWFLPVQAHIAHVGGQDYDLALWQSTGHGAQTFTVNPLFVNPAAGDLQLQAGSQGLGTAVFAPYVREDINGTPRPLTNGDMGAYQQ
jgi:hypothetical protein